MRGFVAGVLVVRALNKLVVEIVKSDSSLGTEVRKKVLEKADTKTLMRTRDEIDRELRERASAASGIQFT